MRRTDADIAPGRLEKREGRWQNQLPPGGTSNPDIGPCRKAKYAGDALLHVIRKEGIGHQYKHGYPLVRLAPCPEGGTGGVDDFASLTASSYQRDRSAFMLRNASGLR